MPGLTDKAIADKKYEMLWMGVDVGSTTVKIAVIDGDTDDILWQDYQRHETKQPEKLLEMLKQIKTDLPNVPDENYRIFITGSGGSGIAKHIGAKFVQEVNAVSLSVEKLYPECGSVIELGGQDAKIIIFKEDPETGKKKKLPSMNDKCAGGTGAVIDKINAKLRIPSDQLCNMGYKGEKLHPVAGKCGVFAETDINGLQKQGVPPNELMASLFESIVQQNLSVLTRGNTLRPTVLLLGGPNCYIKGMRDCWKHNIPKIWEERNYPLPEGVDPETLIKTPDNAQYFACIGAVEFGKQEDPGIGVYVGYDKLEWYMTEGRAQEKAKKGGAQALAKSPEELAEFTAKYTKKKFIPTTFHSGQVVEGFIGIDGGSTSTKAVLVDKDRNILCKTYQLSRGNPIEDTQEVLAKVAKQVTDQGAVLKIMGVGTTGYAKDILKDAVGADVALVETVAHTQAALHFYPDADVICDVGGQDIKIIILRDGRVKDFKLNTQCSAGNGYFLQGTCESFGFKVEDFADIAFNAKGFPQFGYGCAVFMQSDIVDFQRQGWKPEEIMAGLCNVLPKNIWLYVSQIPNLSAIGRKFVLQGGTQHNMAAVKSQVDFIESRFKGKDVKADVIVHQHCGEAGAIGCAFEAVRLWENGMKTEFIGLEGVASITYTTTRDEATRCYFCKNKCLRTFIDVTTATPNPNYKPPVKTKVPLADGAQRLIIATCEKGTVENVEEMRVIKGNIDAIKKENPEPGGDCGEGGVQELRAAGCGRSAAEAGDHQVAKRTHREDEETRRTSYRHAQGAEHVQLRAVLHRLLRSAGCEGRQYLLVRLHQRAALQGRREARRYRSVLPVEGRHSARSQPAVRCPSEEEPECDLLPDDRLAANVPEACAVEPCLPDGDRDSGVGEGGIHQGRQSLRGEGPDLEGHADLSRRSEDRAPADVRRLE